MQTIVEGQFVTAPGFTRAFDLIVLEGRDRDRAIEYGHDWAFTVNAGTMITDDRAYNMQRLAKERANFLDAAVVDNGEVVTVLDRYGNEHTFKVKVNGERYSDPIAFKRN